MRHVRDILFRLFNHPTRVYRKFLRLFFQHALDADIVLLFTTHVVRIARVQRLRVWIHDGKILRETEILAHASDGADVLRALWGT